MLIELSEIKTAAQLVNRVGSKVVELQVPGKIYRCKSAKKRFVKSMVGDQYVEAVLPVHRCRTVQNQELTECQPKDVEYLDGYLFAGYIEYRDGLWWGGYTPEFLDSEVDLEILLTRFVGRLVILKGKA